LEKIWKKFGKNTFSCQEIMGNLEEIWKISGDFNKIKKLPSPASLPSFRNPAELPFENFGRARCVP
jgi:hypothetical protein